MSINPYADGERGRPSVRYSEQSEFFRKLMMPKARKITRRI